MHKCIKIVDFYVRHSFWTLHSSSESLFMFQEGTNGLYLYVKFKPLTTYRDGDINQNRVKISIFTLGKEPCMKFRVKTANCTLRFSTS